jgi:hypothetical protein
MKDTPGMGDNSQSRYEQCKADLDRLEEIKAEKKALSDEAGTIIKRLEKDGGVNRGALAEVRKMLDLSPAAIQAREESRSELMSWLIQPKLDEAAAGQSDE